MSILQAQDCPNPPEEELYSVKEPDAVILPGGVKLPLLGFGTFKITDASSVKAALEVGYRHFDCARIYENEDIVGQGLQEYLSKDPTARESLWITSKVWNDAHRPANVTQSVHDTLNDLNCQYLDLLLIHWPEAWIPGTHDPDTSVTIKDTYQAMEALVDAGKVRFLGVSNFGLTQIEDVLSWCRIKPIVNQIELHPMLAQRKLVGVSNRKGIHSVAYSPLGVGSNELVNHPAVLQISKETGKTPAQVLLRWNVQRGVPVIPKASSKPHIEENFSGLFDWRLTWDQKSALDAIDCGKRFIDPSFHEWEDMEAGGAHKPSKVFCYDSGTDLVSH
jgi:diketogulonate reductase-like aldo/keto reductase